MGRIDWTKALLSMECKPYSVKDDPFEDIVVGLEPSSDLRRRNLGQIMTYAELSFEKQHRTHHYTIVFFGRNARIVRWDRAGAIVTPRIDYKTRAGGIIIARFIWRYFRLSAEARGHDTTASPVVRGSADYDYMKQVATTVLPYGEHARKLFEDSLKNPEATWWKLWVDDREFLVGEPQFVAAGVCGRGTRGYVALETCESAAAQRLKVESEKSGGGEQQDGGAKQKQAQSPFVWLKDCWRVAHEGMEREGDILATLNKGDVPYVPHLVCHSDIPGQQTLTKALWESQNPDSAAGKCPFKTHQHYRMVSREVGLPMSQFNSGLELIFLISMCILGKLYLISDMTRLM